MAPPYSEGLIEFLTQRHLATLTTINHLGRAHVVPVGFTFDADRSVARVITRDGSKKVRNIEAGHPDARAVLCQFDRGRWVSLEGPARIDRSPESVADAELRYTVRYQPPRPNLHRVVVWIDVDRIIGPTAR